MPGVRGSTMDLFSMCFFSFVFFYIVMGCYCIQINQSEWPGQPHGPMDCLCLSTASSEATTRTFMSGQHIAKSLIGSLVSAKLSWIAEETKLYGGSKQG